MRRGNADKDDSRATNMTFAPDALSLPMCDRILFEVRANTAATCSQGRTSAIARELSEGPVQAARDRRRERNGRVVCVLRSSASLAFCRPRNQHTS
jgi:hypothetical protein